MVKKKKLIAFPWYGGKYSHLDFILPHFPKNYRHYVEVFGGSGALLLNKNPSPVETYNDLDSEIVNFFKVLRENQDEFVRILTFTPYSREEFARACDYQEVTNNVERARLFYIRTCQSMNAQPNPNFTSWCVINNSKDNKPLYWHNKIKKINEVAERFKLVQIENKPALEIIKKYDSDTTFFYVDPPYILSTRNVKNMYKFEMTDEKHIELSSILQNIKGQAIISGYNCDLYTELYDNWDRFDAPIKKISSSSRKTDRQESIWLNYKSPIIQKSEQIELFKEIKNDS